MNTVYVIADTHFGHKRIIEFEKLYRPFATIEEHDRVLVERWNAVVRKNDTVWHLGDVFFGKEGHRPLAALNGIKRLVLGNHDHHPMEIYQQYFGKIYGVAEYSNCLLTHVPVHPDQLYTRYSGNIHGHKHHSKLPDVRYVCVSAEQTGLAPMRMDLAVASLMSGL